MIVIDRIEGDFAIIEDKGRILEVKLCHIAGDVRENALLEYENGGYRVIEDSSQSRKKDMEDLLKSLFKRDE